MDGISSEPVWDDALVIDSFHFVGDTITDTDTTIVKLIYNDSFLYIAAECHDSHPGKFKLTRMWRGSRVYLDDNIQIFIKPVRNYFLHFYVNPFGVQRNVKVQNEFIWGGENLQWHAPTIFSENKWTCEMAIPLEFIFKKRHYSDGFIAAEKSFKFNIGRKKKKGRKNPIFTSWAYVDSLRDHPHFAHLSFEKDIQIKPNTESLTPTYLQEFDVAKRMQKYRPRLWGKNSELMLGWRYERHSDFYLDDINLFTSEFGWHPAWTMRVLKNAIRLGYRRKKAPNKEQLFKWNGLLQSLDSLVSTPIESFNLIMAKINIDRISGNHIKNNYRAELRQIIETDPSIPLSFAHQFYNMDTGHPGRSRKLRYNENLVSAFNDIIIDEFGIEPDT